MFINRQPLGADKYLQIRQQSTLSCLVEASNISSPWIWNSVSATLQSGRYTLKYPGGRIIADVTEKTSGDKRFSADKSLQIRQQSTLSCLIEASNISSPWIWNSVSATLQSGRYTLSYPKGRIIADVTEKTSGDKRFSNGYKWQNVWWWVQRTCAWGLLMGTN